MRDAGAVAARAARSVAGSTARLGEAVSRQAPQPASTVAPLLMGIIAATWVALGRAGWAAGLVPVSVAGLLLLVAGLFSCRSGPVATGVGLWAGSFVVARAGRPVEALWSALFGCLLTGVLEFSWLSARTRSRVRLPARARRAHLAVFTTCTVGGFVLAWATGEVAGAGWAPDSVLTVGGGAAALLALLLLVVAAAARTRR